MSEPLSDPLGVCGTVIADKYRVDYVVGEGGFSVVYRAEHIIWKQPVALKCFKALANVPANVREDLLQGFIQEGKLMTSLSSRTAAIVQARDVGTFTSPQGLQVPYMVLEWLEGQSLDHVLVSENQRGMPARSIEDAMMLLEPIVGALETVHQMNIAHRDVKPANLFIVGDARKTNTFVKILDFGIAKVMAEHAQLQTALAQTGQEITAFTPNYGAPEQFSRSHGATGPWTDVFALALILVELVRGAPALQGNDYLQLAVASRDPMVRPTPRSLGVQVTDAVEATFHKALAVSPRERFRTAGEFWAALYKAVFPEQPTWIPSPQGASPMTGNRAPGLTGPGGPMSARASGASFTPPSVLIAGAPTVRTDPNSGAQSSGFIEHHFFHRHPADTLHDAPFNLSPVDGRVHTGPEIMHDLHRIQFIGSAQAVHRYVHDGRAVNVVGKGVAFFFGRVEMNFRCGIVCVFRQAHPFGECGQDQPVPIPIRFLVAYVNPLVVEGNIRYRNP